MLMLFLHENEMEGGNIPFKKWPTFLRISFQNFQVILCVKCDEAAGAYEKERKDYSRWLGKKDMAKTSENSEQSSCQKSSLV